MDHIWVTPLPQLGLWTFEPTLFFFHTPQRFPISNHVTSGWMSPRSSLDHWAAVSHTGNDMTSSSGHVIALDQSGASIFSIRAHFTTSNSCNLRCHRTSHTTDSGGKCSHFGRNMEESVSPDAILRSSCWTGIY